MSENIPSEKVITALTLNGDESQLDIRRKIVRLEASMRALNLPEVDCPTRHEFTDGAYIREVFIPAGTLVVGKLHRYEHFNFISRGEVTFITESGGLQRVQAPISMISPAGTKRVLYAHEDTVWAVIHVTCERDLEKIEAEVIAKNYSDMGLEDPMVDVLESKEV